MKTKPVTKPKKASRRMSKTLMNYIANGGSKKSAMLDAGYSPATAKNPAKIFNTNAMRSLMYELGINEQYILENVREAIDKTPRNDMSWGEKLQYLRFSKELLGYSQDSMSNSAGIMQFIQKYYESPTKDKKEEKTTS